MQGIWPNRWLHAECSCLRLCFRNSMAALYGRTQAFKVPSSWVARHHVRSSPNSRAVIWLWQCFGRCKLGGLYCTALTIHLCVYAGLCPYCRWRDLSSVPSRSLRIRIWTWGCTAAACLRLSSTGLEHNAILAWPSALLFSCNYSTYCAYLLVAREKLTFEVGKFRMDLVFKLYCNGSSASWQAQTPVSQGFGSL